jgi:thiol-disulfide isomerase/thioredoxin
LNKIYFFSGKFCGPCRMIKNRLKENNIHIIDIEENTELAIKFKVMNVPTFVKVDNQDNEISKKIGAMSPQEILNF